MKKIKANISSRRDYLVNENGQIFSPFGKELTGKLNPNSKTLRSLDFMNNDGKRQAMSFQKIIWNTFNPNNTVSENEIIILKDDEIEFPFSIKNLEKVGRKENVQKINKIRLDKIKIRKDKKL